jgi:hypothetical protein
MGGDDAEPTSVDRGKTIGEGLIQTGQQMQSTRVTFPVSTLLRLRLLPTCGPHHLTDSCLSVRGFTS